MKMEMNLKIEGFPGHAHAKVDLPDDLLCMAALAGRETLRRFVASELQVYVEGLVDECVKNGALKNPS